MESMVRQVWVQYGRYLGRLAQGDFGQSLSFRMPAAAVALERLPATLELTLAAMVLAVLVSVPAAVLAAMRRGTLFDRVLMGLTLIGQTVPTFWRHRRRAILEGRALFAGVAGVFFTTISTRPSRCARAPQTSRRSARPARILPRSPSARGDTSSPPPHPPTCRQRGPTGKRTPRPFCSTSPNLGRPSLARYFRLIRSTSSAATSIEWRMSSTWLISEERYSA
jgi:hypothetical protein